MQTESSLPYPVGLGAQFRRNLWMYASGAVLLGAQQYLMAQRDFLVKAAVNAADALQSTQAARAAIAMLLVSVGAAYSTGVTW